MKHSTCHHYTSCYNKALNITNIPDIVYTFLSTEKKKYIKELVYKHSRMVSKGPNSSVIFPKLSPLQVGLLVLSYSQQTLFQYEMLTLLLLCLILYLTSQ